MKNDKNSLLSLVKVGVAIQNLNKSWESKVDLTLVQWSTLRALIDMPGISANGLAKAVGVHPSTLTQTIKRLERKKYVFISLDPTDSRRKMISITREGRDHLLEANKLSESWARSLSDYDSSIKALLNWFRQV